MKNQDSIAPEIIDDLIDAEKGLSITKSNYERFIIATIIRSLERLLEKVPKEAFDLFCICRDLVDRGSHDRLSVLNRRHFEKLLGSYPQNDTGVEYSTQERAINRSLLNVLRVRDIEFQFFEYEFVEIIECLRRAGLEYSEILNVVEREIASLKT